jgi:hypothetical protein
MPATKKPGFVPDCSRAPYRPDVPWGQARATGDGGQSDAGSDPTRDESFPTEWTMAVPGVHFRARDEDRGSGR